MKNKETICVSTSGTHNGAITPVDPSTANHYIGQEDIAYPRYFNTVNQKVIVDKLSQLEQAETGLIFSSGMAAISTALLSLLKSGDHVLLAKEIYGGTHKMVTEEFEKFGISYDFVSCDKAEEVTSKIRKETMILYFETPSNPLLSIADIKTLAALAKKHSIYTIVDNTFATPICQNPIALGVDVVVHSGTKYLGGHSDLSFGALLTSKVLHKKILSTSLNLGGSLNSWDCYLIERSLKTLSVRVERQCNNALTIAQFLQQHPKVASVFYPGLSDHPGYTIAAQQMGGKYGAMLSFELKSKGNTPAFVSRLKHIEAMVSLGGVESTICQPSETSHKKMPKETREAIGVTDDLLRLSVGIENVNDLIADMEEALAF